MQQACCPGMSGEGAGCTLGCPGAAVWGGRVVLCRLGQKRGSELAWPWLQGCISGEFSRAGGAGLVLTLLQVPSQ